jgi:uncharacterized protein YndB with AHSA1/START domain
MIKIIAIAAVVLVAALLVYAATKPDTFRVERTGTIKAPPEKIFPFLNDFREGAAWSPYEKRDPNMKRTYSGPASGKGSVYVFEGNKNVGTGRLEILESTPPSKVVIALDMMSPLQATASLNIRSNKQGTVRTLRGPCTGPFPIWGSLSVYL